MRRFYSFLPVLANSLQANEIFVILSNVQSNDQLCCTKHLHVPNKILKQLSNISGFHPLIEVGCNSLLRFFLGLSFSSFVPDCSLAVLTSELQVQSTNSS